MQEPGNWLWPCKCIGHMPGRMRCSTAPAPVPQKAVTCAQGGRSACSPRAPCPVCGGGRDDAASQQTLLFLALCTCFHCQPAQQGCSDSRPSRAHLATGARVLMWVAISPITAPSPTACHTPSPSCAQRPSRAIRGGGWLGEVGRERRMPVASLASRAPTRCAADSQGRTTFEPSTPVR